MIPRPRHELRGARAAALLLGLVLLAAIDLRAAVELGPAALLAIVLSLGFRPGERLVERIHAYRERRAKLPAPVDLTPRFKPRRTISLIGRIAASGLAMRPPPQLRLT